MWIVSGHRVYTSLTRVRVPKHHKNQRAYVYMGRVYTLSVYSLRRARRAASRDGVAVGRIYSGSGSGSGSGSWLWLRLRLRLRLRLWLWLRLRLRQHRRTVNADE